MASRKQVTDAVYSQVDGLSRNQAGEAVDCVFDCISNHLTDGERVQIPGFGTFVVSERAARDGINPATRQRIRIPASKGVRFKPAKDLKEKLNR